MNIQEILNTHKQIFPKSCPSSVMELVLKLHGKMKLDCFDIQNKYGDNNVGFTKSFELEKNGRGLKPKEHRLPSVEALAKCEEENKAGRFPLVSLPTESRKSFFFDKEWIADDSNHIFITVLNPELTLVCHAYNGDSPLLYPKVFDIVKRIQHFDPSFQINFLTYSM